MKILFDNLVYGATLSAVYEDETFPVTNIRHAFIKKVFKSTSITDIITIELSSVSTINSAYIAFTNASYITVNMYNSGDTLLDTQIIDINKKGITFDDVENVSYVTFEMVAPSLLYVGMVGVGYAFDMPDPIQDWTPDVLNNSTEESSLDGQTLMNVVPWIEMWKANFRVENIADYLEIRSLLSQVETPIFVDLFDGNKLIFPPFPAKIAFVPESKNYKTFKFLLTITEVR